jgi:hypothetical protein
MRESHGKAPHGLISLHATAVRITAGYQALLGYQHLCYAYVKCHTVFDWLSNLLHLSLESGRDRINWAETGSLHWSIIGYLWWYNLDVKTEMLSVSKPIIVGSQRCRYNLD